MRSLNHVRTCCLVAAVAVLTSACAATYTTHGYTPPQVELDEILVGVDTREDVASTVGRPADTGLVDDDAWYYLSSRVRTLAFFEPVVEDRSLVAIQFDEAGFVRDVTTYGIEDGKPVELVTRTTETFGRELTIVQQFIGNLFNLEIGE